MKVSYPRILIYNNKNICLFIYRPAIKMNESVPLDNFLVQSVRLLQHVKSYSGLPKRARDQNCVHYIYTSVHAVQNNFPVTVIVLMLIHA